MIFVAHERRRLEERAEALNVGRHLRLRLSLLRLLLLLLDLRLSGVDDGSVSAQSSLICFCEGGLTSSSSSSSLKRAAERAAGASREQALPGSKSNDNAAS